MRTDSHLRTPSDATPTPERQLPDRQQHDRTTPRVQAFDAWIRSRFVDLNTELEDLYASQKHRTHVAGVGDELKSALVEEGRELIAALLDEGNTDEGFDRNFELLGNVGYYMAACRRHEITEPSRERVSPLTEASALALHLGASCGTVPRFVSSHMETYNRAVDGVYRTFTWRDDEKIFLDYNTRSALAYMRAADALVRVHPMGVSHPASRDLFVDARRALDDVLALNIELAGRLDVTEFFHCVRPYYKPYRVGTQEYRGANAGDFAAFNQVDILLGLCSPADPGYSPIVMEKFSYLTPNEQERLRDTFRYPNLLDSFLDRVERADQPWFTSHAAAYLEVCASHAAVARQHHDELVATFITSPSRSLADDELQGITASGPPLEVLLRSLEKLRDLRSAADRDDIASRHHDIERLRRLVATS